MCGGAPQDNPLYGLVMAIREKRKKFDGNGVPRPGTAAASTSSSPLPSQGFGRAAIIPDSTRKVMG